MWHFLRHPTAIFAKTSRHHSYTFYARYFSAPDKTQGRNQFFQYNTLFQRFFNLPFVGRHLVTTATIEQKYFGSTQAQSGTGSVNSGAATSNYSHCTLDFHFFVQIDIPQKVQTMIHTWHFFALNTNLARKLSTRSNVNRMVFFL